MTFRRRVKLSAMQRMDMWNRWKAGQSLHEIGRALGKDHVVVSSSQISQTDTVTLSGTGTVAIAQLSPGSLHFGNQRVNTSSASQNVTLLNTGDGPLTLSTIFTTGPYSQANNCGSSIAPGTCCNIAVVFTPTVRGTVNGTLSITGNQQGTAPVTALVGTGH